MDFIVYNDKENAGLTKPGSKSHGQQTLNQKSRTALGVINTERKNIDLSRSSQPETMANKRLASVSTVSGNATKQVLKGTKSEADAEPIHPVPTEVKPANWLSSDDIEMESMDIYTDENEFMDLMDEPERPLTYLKQFMTWLPSHSTVSCNVCTDSDIDLSNVDDEVFSGNNSLSEFNIDGVCLPPLGEIQDLYDVSSESDH